MVLPIAAAAQAGSTVLGLGIGKTDLDLTRDLFKMQMQQAKRLWTADWAEASLRHGEQCMQSAQQHAEAQAMATASYIQADKMASQGIKLARDQDSRSYEMTWRAEVRESLRDELVNQNNRFNIVMLCDSVCLSCAFSLVAEGNMPLETPTFMVNIYVACMGVTITLFSVSLWCAIIVVRRLHEHTAAILERKLFVQSEDLQKVWLRQLSLNLPTGPNEIYLVNQAYEKWVAQYLNPIGNTSVHMMAFGVVMLFITGGILTHYLYLIKYNSVMAGSLFFSCVFITSATVLYMKYSEDRKEKRKLGVYDNSWQDQRTAESDPFAKISRAAEELFSEKAVELGSAERVESLMNREQREQDFCAKTKSLHLRVESLIEESDQRTRMRKDVLKLLTTAAEELDALPEELTSRLNKVLHDIDEADSRTANLVGMKTEKHDAVLNEPLNIPGSNMNLMPVMQKSQMRPMSLNPIDAQRIPLSLGSLRRKLGEYSISTLLRLKNLSNGPLRLKSGVQLKQGSYIKSLNATDPNNSSVCYQLYPGTEIPPRSEVVIAARSVVGWTQISGIEGELVYTNRDESWLFRIKFSNNRVRQVRKCQVLASHVGGYAGNKFWTISKDELDIKANNEVAITIDILRGDEGRRAVLNHAHAQLTVKTGFLLKNRTFGLGLQWLQRWVVLTPEDIVYSETIGCKKRSTIALKDISSVRLGFDMVKNNVFEIHTKGKESVPFRFCAVSPEERDDW
eukprot:CAMPEP_0194314176 /NCGR_PEP_ID=MMETSP0171-20130528/11006_1 /TAXON_ID=218684 /ORGANISM="Corethron pennatum, Strain L29A3" /LENGTH=736 /DNA_ID=CAMNT_0039069457 /DNA_START=151 /DNA_END=2358 /DNA_ORIENTATION=+